MGKRRRRKYSLETKAAVLAALLEGQVVSAVAADYKIPRATIDTWRRRRRLRGEFQMSKAEKDRETVGELLLGYLAENLKTLRVQSIFFRNEKWLAEQDAASVATLHGVTADKAVRLLEALEAGVREQERSEAKGESGRLYAGDIPSV